MSPDPYETYDYDFFPRMPPQDPEPFIIPSTIEDVSRQGMNIYLSGHPPVDDLSERYLSTGDLAEPILPHRGSINFVASTLDSFSKVYDLGLLRSQPSIISFSFNKTADSVVPETNGSYVASSCATDEIGPLIKLFPLENLASLEEIQFRGVMPPFSKEGIEALSDMLLASGIPQVKLTLFPSFSGLCLSTRLFFNLVSRLPKVLSVDLHLLNLPNFDVDTIKFNPSYVPKVKIFSRSKDPIELVNLASANFELEILEG
jgi:hypothetical protein